MSRKTYHVSPHPKGWQVKPENAERANRVVDTKAEAVQLGRELAKAQELGQLVVHKQDGTIQTEHTYRQDPFPPAG